MRDTLLFLVSALVFCAAAEASDTSASERSLQVEIQSPSAGFTVEDTGFLEGGKRIG